LASAHDFFEFAANLVFQIELLQGKLVLLIRNLAERARIFNRNRDLAGYLGKERKILLRECVFPLRAEDRTPTTPPRPVIGT
jgi:hypothetical protein